MLKGIYHRMECENAHIVCFFNIYIIYVAVDILKLAYNMGVFRYPMAFSENEVHSYMIVEFLVHVRSWIKAPGQSACV